MHFLEHAGLGFVCELIGGPLDGSYLPLLIDGLPKHPSQLTPADLQIVPTKTNTDLLTDEPYERSRSPGKGEFLYRQAIYAFDSLKAVGDKLVPRFVFRREMDVRAPG